MRSNVFLNLGKLGIALEFAIRAIKNVHFKIIDEF